MISGNPKLAALDRIRRSQASDSSAPPPSACPFIPAITGLGASSIARCTSIQRRIAAWLLSDRSRMTAMSAPATKNRPVPVITMHRTSGSAASGGSTERNSSIIAGSTALAGGRSIRTVATLPSRVTRSTVIASSLGHAGCAERGQPALVESQQFGQHGRGVLAEQWRGRGERAGRRTQPRDDPLVLHGAGDRVLEDRVEATGGEMFVAVHEVLAGRDHGRRDTSGLQNGGDVGGLALRGPGGERGVDRVLGGPAGGEIAPSSTRSPPVTSTSARHWASSRTATATHRSFPAAG